jgi:plastocyanin
MMREDSGSAGLFANRLDRRRLVRIGIAAPAATLAAAALGVTLRDSFTAGASGTPAAAPGSSPVSCASPTGAAPTAASPAASPIAGAIVLMTAKIRFEPADLTIRAGETVTWRNDGTIPHTTTDDPTQNPVATSHADYALLPAGAAPWNSGLLQPGQSFSHTFTVPGDYHYFCIPHVLSGMRGMITVTC